MHSCLAFVLASCLVSEVPAAPNLVRNPSFEEDAGRDGLPPHWRFSGDSRRVQQTLSLDAGRDGKRCARLDCT